MPAPPRHPTPPFNNLHPHDRKNTAVMGISISHMRNQSPGNHPGEQISSLHCVSIAGAAGIFLQTPEVGELEIALLRPVLAAFIIGS